MLHTFGDILATKSLRRRSLSAALLAAYITTAAGVPLPSGAKPQASGEAYPCANCACGCASAEQCWRSCCCHTLAERFAWAHEHKVRPPEYAIAQARVAGVDVAWLGIPNNVTCCAHKSNDERPACCQAHAACCAHKNAQQQKKNGGDRIVAWRALACHGHSLHWLTAITTLVVVRPEVSQHLPLVAWLGPAVSDVAEKITTYPEVPPPKRA